MTRTWIAARLAMGSASYLSALLKPRVDDSKLCPHGLDACCGRLALQRNSFIIANMLLTLIRPVKISAMTLFRLSCIGLLALASCFLVSCASPGTSYADQHPELSPVQRQIFIAGHIPNGTAIAGLTREQVRMVMGRDPSVFEKIDGEDAWVFVRKKTVARNFQPVPAQAPGTNMQNNRSFTEEEGSAPSTTMNEKTTVFFQGNLATHAEYKEERP